MKLLVAFLSTCALALGAALPRFDDKVIGGNDTTIEKFPYTVSLQYHGRPSCGGSIVNENTILTACQCVRGFNPKGITVRVGSTHNTDGEEFEVAKVIEHPDFMKDVAFNNDVAILKLARPLTFSDQVKPVLLQTAYSPVPEGGTGYVTGWGTTIADEPAFPSKLQVAEVEFISNARCEKLYAEFSEIPEQMLCTQTSGKGACQGDSGSPLVAYGSQVGVVSWGYGCANPIYPEVYAKVSLLRDFIDKYS